MHPVGPPWSRLRAGGIALLLASAGVFAEPPPAKPAKVVKPSALPSAKAASVPVVAPVRMGDSLETVMSTLGAPLGTIQKSGATAFMYADGEVELRDGKVVRIRWKGMVTRSPAQKITLARETAGVIQFKRADPAQVAAKHEAARKAVQDQYKASNTRIKVVGTAEIPAKITADPPPAPEEAPVPAVAPPEPAPLPPIVPDVPVIPVATQ